MFRVWIRSGRCARRIFETLLVLGILGTIVYLRYVSDGFKSQELITVFWGVVGGCLFALFFNAVFEFWYMKNMYAGFKEQRCQA